MSETQIVEQEETEDTPDLEPEEEAGAGDDAEPEEEAGAGDDAEPEGEDPTKAGEKDPQRSVEEIQRELNSYKARGAEERRLRQEEARRNRQLNDRLERIEQVYRREQQQRNEPQQEALPELPKLDDLDFENDPLNSGAKMQDAVKTYRDYIARLHEQNQTFQRERDQQARQQQAYQQQAQQFMSVKNQLDMEDAQYSQEKPDYPEAVNYLAGIKMQEYMRYGATREQAMTQLQEDILRMSQSAWQQGLRPAEAAYETALQYGFKPESQRNKVSPLESVKRGQAAAKTMSGGGKSPRGPVNISELAKIDDDAEFEKQFDAWEKKQLGVR